MQETSTLEEMFNRDLTVTDLTVDGKCSNCGACCNDIIPLTNADINRIKNYVKKNNIKPINHSNNFLVRPSYDAVCPFRDEENSICTIYSVRPAICRFFTCHDYYQNYAANHKKINKNTSKKLSCRKVFFEA